MLECRIVNHLKVGRKVVCGVFLIMLLTASLFAAEPVVQLTPEGQMISEFNCEEGFGIRKALALLGSMCDKNIVPSSQVDGQLAFRTLRNVTFEEAMDAILGEGFVYEQQGNLIKVYTREEYKTIKEDEARMIYKVFTLYYISSEEAVKLLNPVLSDKAKIDQSSAAEIGITGSSSGGGDKMALNDTIVLFDYPENIEKAENVLSAVDVRPKQVLVEATILSATLTENTQFGIDWNFSAGVSLIGTEATSDLVSGDSISRGTTATTPIGQIAAGVEGSPIETAGFSTTGMNGLRIGATYEDMTAFVTALETVTDVTILANPKILAVNKQQGYVQIGKTLHYRGATTIGQGGVASEGEDKSLDTGTVLSFRPYIGNDGYIRMDISPKDSSATLNADKLPDETKAEVRTNIIVKDGETIIIGGLFRDVITTGRSQVPLLGDIPLIGVLFRGTTDISERQEVMVLLTPHIIEEPVDTEAQERAADISRKITAAKDAMQWVDRARLAEDAYSRAASLYLEGDYEAAMDQLAIALNLRPTYLEALKLKERILNEVSPEEAQKLERVILDSRDEEDFKNWTRR